MCQVRTTPLAYVHCAQLASGVVSEGCVAADPIGDLADQPAIVVGVSHSLARRVGHRSDALSAVACNFEAVRTCDPAVSVIAQGQPRGCGEPVVGIPGIGQAGTVGVFQGCQVANRVVGILAGRAGTDGKRNRGNPLARIIREGRHAIERIGFRESCGPYCRRRGSRRCRPDR